MKQPSVYLKMRVLGAIDTVHGTNTTRTRPQRRRHDLPRRGRQPTPVHLAHHPDLVLPLQKPRHHQHDQPLTQGQGPGPQGHPRGTPRSHQRRQAPLPPTNAPTNAPSIASASRRACCTPTASPRPPSTASFATTTCSRPDNDDNKKRLAFSMKYANQLWQADTMFGPYVDTGCHRAANRPSSSPSSTTPAASSATASSSSRKTSTPWSRPSAPPSTNAASPNSSWSTTVPSTAPRKLPVLYLALIAFRVECCRIVIRSADVCYTENLAKLAHAFYPAPRSWILIVPRHYPAPLPFRYNHDFRGGSTRGRATMVLPQRRGMERHCRTAQADALSALQGRRHADSARLSVRL